MKEKEPPAQIIYNRTGNLSTTTKLNQKVADEFMGRGDMRRDILIVDSDVKPETNTIAVGSDTLAFRAIEPIRKLTEVRFKPKPFHTLVRQDSCFEIQVHERIIDDKVRKEHFIDRSNYEEQFLKLLNKAVKSGSTQALSQEKLGLPDQAINYGLYCVYFIWRSTFALLLGVNPLAEPLVFFLFNGAINLCSEGVRPIKRYRRFVPPHRRRFSNLVEAISPLVQIDKWIAGWLFLARHGDKVIIPP